MILFQVVQIYIGIDTNKRLGIGVAAPAALLEINGTGDAIRVDNLKIQAREAANNIDLLVFFMVVLAAQ